MYFGADEPRRVWTAVPAGGDRKFPGLGALGTWTTSLTLAKWDSPGEKLFVYECKHLSKLSFAPRVGVVVAFCVCKCVLSTREKCDNSGPHGTAHLLSLGLERRELSSLLRGQPGGRPHCLSHPPPGESTRFLLSHHLPAGHGVWANSHRRSF